MLFCFELSYLSKWWKVHQNKMSSIILHGCPSDIFQHLVEVLLLFHPFGKAARFYANQRLSLYFTQRFFDTLKYYIGKFGQPASGIYVLNILLDFCFIVIFYVILFKHFFVKLYFLLQKRKHLLLHWRIAAYWAFMFHSIIM